MYDLLPGGSMVKLWGCEMKVLRVGDSVPPLYPFPKYIVLLREGGYVRVKENIITKIVENHGRKYYKPSDFPGVQCVDKWGTALNNDEDLIRDDMMGEDYYYKGDK